MRVHREALQTTRNFYTLLTHRLANTLLDAHQACNCSAYSAGYTYPPALTLPRLLACSALLWLAYQYKQT